MNEIEEIVRVAARGDGVTASGRHVPGTAPGDRILADGAIEAGPHHAKPPCRHVPACGGCQLQHCDEQSLARFVHDRVVLAAQGQGLEAQHVAPVHLSPARSRRRATLHASGAGGRVLIGFREARTHKVVDMRECHVLAPALFAVIAPLRTWLSRSRKRFAADIELAQVDQGVDMAIKGVEVEGLAQTETLLDLCRSLKLARLSLDQGYGPETFWEPDPVTVTLGGTRVSYPSGAFLQATADGEAALVAAASEWLAPCDAIADLFAGLGTFALAMKAGKVLAVEAARDSHLACRSAAGRSAGRVAAAHRDLFRNPMRPEELQSFDGVVLDPPRAGARVQVEQLAASAVQRIVYVSCNPSSWARDGALLAAAGYELRELRPVGQFRWSTHVELASLFVRDIAWEGRCPADS